MNFSIHNDVPAYVAPPNRRADSLQEAVDGMFDVIYSNPQVTPAVSVIPYSNSVDITDVFVQNDKSKFEAANGWTMEGLGIDDLDASDVTYQDRSSGKGVWSVERFKSQKSDGSYNLSLSKPANEEIPVLSQGEMQTWCNNHYYYYYGTRCIKVSKGPDNRYYIGGYFKSTNGLLTMTQNAPVVRSYVKSLEPAGGTAGHLGAAWGLYSLVPSWQNFFKHDAGKPQKFDKTTEKYLVIMTDGEFNSAQKAGMSSDDIFQYFSSICAKARSKNITIFTVGLKVTDDTKTSLGLQNCVGTTGRYFPVESHEELKDAFIKIGRETGELRLSS
jgi:hypothetical protein